MKAAEVKEGGEYLAKVNGRMVKVRVDQIREVSTCKGRSQTYYNVTNLATGRKTTFRSAAKFRGPAPRGPVAVRRKAEVEAGGEQRPDPIAQSATTPAWTRTTPPDRPIAEAAEGLSPGDNGQSITEEWVSVEPPSFDVTVVEPDEAERAAAQQIAAPDGLKGDQADAFRRVCARLSLRRQYTKLVGYAGTGKTWLLARVAAWAKDNGFRVTVCAPTHKAAGVIKDKLGDVGRGIEVGTIHSLLGLKLEPDFENDTGGRILRAEGRKEPPTGLVICDEASMVGSELKEHVDRTPDVVWLFVGDLAQLPPVGESVSELLDEPHAELAKVLRQSEGSEILNLATRVRRGDLSMEHVPGLDVFRVDSAEDLFQAALRRFDSDAFRADGSHARMLVFKNARRQAINVRMRSLLIDSEDPYVPGEWLVMYAQFSPDKSRLNLLAEKCKAGEVRWKRFYEAKDAVGRNVAALHVSQEVRIEAAEPGAVAFGDVSFDVWTLAVRTREGAAHSLPVLMDHVVPRFEEHLRGVRERAQDARRRRDECAEWTPAWQAAERERRDAWRDFFALEETFARVDRAYAMTVHKAQGSTFDHAFVDVPDLMSSGGMQQRILYTAVTRPSKSLTFYV